MEEWLPTLGGVSQLDGSLQVTDVVDGHLLTSHNRQKLMMNETNFPNSKKN